MLVGVPELQPVALDGVAEDAAPVGVPLGRVLDRVAVPERWPREVKEFARESDLFGVVEDRVVLRDQLPAVGLDSLSPCLERDGSTSPPGGLGGITGVWCLVSFQLAFDSLSFRF